MNKHIVEQFNLLIKQIEAEQLYSQIENNTKETSMHKFRLATVKKIVNIISKLDFEITNADELSTIPGIGAGTIKRIREILETGHLSELNEKYANDTKKQSTIASIQELSKVIGIGNEKAKVFVLQNGITSVDELKAAIASNKIKVTRQIMTGLKYYGVVQGAIPRDEITATQTFIQKIAKSIDPQLNAIVCGSYRRGRPTSGDIDLLLYHPDITSVDQIIKPHETKSRPYLQLLIDRLTKCKLLIDDLTFDKFNVSYMGFSKFKKAPVRRMDIIYIPFGSLDTALLYFTGPYELNTDMRSAAKKRDLFLNQYGLYRRDPDTGKPTNERVDTKSEQDVFEVLGMKYLTPVQRDKYSTPRVKKTKIVL